MSYKPSINARLLRGEIVTVGEKLYQRCGVCEKIIRVNKPLVGELHFCLTDEEAAAKRQVQP